MDSNQIISVIEAPHGNFFNVNMPPPVVTDKNVTIQFRQDNQNTVHLVFTFDDTPFSQESAERYTETLTKNIALQLSLENTLHFDWKSNVQTSWRTPDPNEIKGYHMSSSVKVHISGAIRIKLHSDTFKINFDRNSNLSVLQDAISLFNKALFYKEQQNKTREVAFWLFLSWESIQLTYGCNEADIIAHIVKLNVVQRNTLNRFKFSIGKYYRHMKGIPADQSELSIKECIDIMSNILLSLTNGSSSNMVNTD